MEENKLIVLEQLPIIKATLENLSVEIKEKVDNATSLICTEDTVKEVKQVRANLTKEFNELESQRKAVKQAIMSKYDEFEEVYKENVSNLYKKADLELKEKIDNVENELKVEKELELREFYNQHYQANNIYITLPFERINLNITLSASMKSLKEQIKGFLEKVGNDLKLIELEEYKEEILFEYQNTLDFAKSKMKVIERKKQLEEIKKQQEIKQEQEKQEEKIVEKVEEVITPPKEIISEDEVIKVQFTIETTKQNIIELKNWLNERGIKYE